MSQSRRTAGVGVGAHVTLNRQQRTALLIDEQNRDRPAWVQLVIGNKLSVCIRNGRAAG